ncbi:multidrug efflux SMR transporter [Burkholderia cenocepacia]|uniref:DMT family transporter n=1 Tax=Burkholderia cenocepacia TaxID=95486 RepID=UPI001BA24EAA|nr:multidrug efflux SMR transporter [Burkholderia cenocepacia]MBR8374452.1 multidrug efflux SMR transporter [Burkholderia cenocepacia]
MQTVRCIVTSSRFAWFVLGLSVIAEVFGTIGLKFSSGFTHLPSSVFTVVCYAGAIWLMSITTLNVEVGLAYAAWAGASTAITAGLGILLFGESVSVSKLCGLAMAAGSLVLLNLSDGPT